MAPSNTGELLNSDANFEGFWQSMDTLFRCMTGESFNGIMHDTMIEPPYCDPCEAGYELQWMDKATCESTTGFNGARSSYDGPNMCCVPCDDVLSGEQHECVFGLSGFVELRLPAYCPYLLCLLLHVYCLHAPLADPRSRPRQFFRS